MARDVRPKAQEDTKETIYIAFLYKNGTGEPLKLFDEDKYNDLLKNGYSDCPTKAVQSKDPKK